ncbi:MAG: PAS domain S-box protein, partial [Actinomycetota bacterium]|nr:PAS domain S-box protein [Actinomycetota bacterium]
FFFLILFYLVILKNQALASLSKKLHDSENLFRTIFEQAPIGIVTVNNFNFMSRINKELEKILGRERNEVVSLDWKDITHPEDLAEDLRLFKKFKSGEIDSYSIEKRFIKPDGTIVWVDMTIAGLDLSGDENHSHLCIMRDITEKKKVMDTLKESERSKSVLLSNLPGIAYRCKYNKEWTMLFISDGCLKLTGYKPENLINNKDLSYNQLIAPEYTDIIWKEWERVLALKIPFQFEYEIITASGQRKWVWEMGQAIYDSNGNVEALEGIIIDIDESKKRQLQIKFMGEHDYLTGLYNRSYYEEAKARFGSKEYLPISIILIDINGVRLINDALGYFEGDNIINETGKIIKSTISENAVLARIGGDEFGIILPGTDRENAKSLLYKIEDAVSQYNAKLKEKARYISIAIGYGTRESLEENIRDAEKEAEEYMNKRKLLERNSYHHTILSSIMDTMYARSQETEQHAKRLANISKLIGERMNLSQEKMNELQLFAMLHDIGKVAIDDKILNKPGKLTEKEWGIMRKHSKIGYRITMASPELESIAEYILYHHERWDGKGYPSGLKGEETPLLSRILIFADAYDAMTVDRVYRKAMTKQEAIEEIRRNVGKQFDPGIFKIFNEIIQDIDF